MLKGINQALVGSVTKPLIPPFICISHEFAASNILCELSDEGSIPAYAPKTSWRSN